MMEEEKTLIPLIVVFVMMGIAGVVSYQIGVTVEHEMAWAGFVYWCVFLGIMLVFGVIPMVYFWKHPEKLENPTKR